MIPHRIQTHPGEFLYRVFLEPNGMSISKAAKAIGVSTSSLSRLIKGEFNLTGEMAIKLSELCGNSPEMWMNMQSNHSISKAYAESGKTPVTEDDLVKMVRLTAERINNGETGFVSSKEANEKIKAHIESLK